MPQKRNKDVFINCPFDGNYQANLYLICYVVLYCGYNPKTALEINNAADSRLNKIIKLIRECDFAIHDLSMVTIDANTNMPRFNMPFECGIFYGINSISTFKRSVLVFELNARDTQASLSDLLGIDPVAHRNEKTIIATKVRDYLRQYEKEHIIPGGDRIYQQYQEFVSEIPALASAIGLNPRSMLYNDTLVLMAGFIAVQKASRVLA